jgi:SSS family solute:Na+ symporter
MGFLDIIVVAAYLIAVVGLGCWSGWNRNADSSTLDPGSAKGYFLAGRELRWPIIGMALFSTNISTVHLVGLAQAGYESGLLMGNFELLAVIPLAMLALFFAPFYIRSRVVTLPDFLEQRYSRRSRDIFAVVSVLSAIFVHIGFSLFTGAVVLNGIFEINLPKAASILTVAALTGLYTILGGLTAVVVTESVQTIVLLAGAFTITLFAWMRVDGWQGIVAHVPAEHLTLLRGSGEGNDLPWYSFALGYPVIGVWYWCTDQTIVQRVLGARDENHARTGALFAGVLKLLPLFVFVLPGVICFALVKQGAINAEQVRDSSNVYATLIRELLPTGLKGLVAAALLAAIMSTVSGALNSIGTLVSYDLVQRLRPNISDRALVSIGRWSSFLSLILAILWSLTLHPEGIFQSVNAMITYIAPPITCVFLFGVFWRRASSTAAAATLGLGSAAGMVLFLLGHFEVAWWMDGVKRLRLDFLLIGVLLFGMSSVVMIVLSLWKPHDHTPQSVDLVWKSVWEPLKSPGWPGVGNYKFLTLVLLGSWAAIYWLFS